MSDTTGEKQAYNDLSMRTIFLIGLLSAVGLFVIITGARTLFYKWQAAEYQEKVINVPLASVDAELQEQRAAIERYSWNATTDSAAIPVDKAMAETVEELAAERAEQSESDAADSESTDADSTDEAGSEA
ncbi:hypothetical protein [Alienimonas chondri]|uniref:Uncharacterized protein n=1 Tax=Alienimonas chondri TaxID=2681879 RepID=A0ABX1V9Q2_9PLAN|nr:hypothetical protein [Alienimonas chondri]NNJ24822.1 hypothetical protein [Alienimonas chondri]